MNTSSLAAVADTGQDRAVDFVDPGSIVRRIWGDGDMVLLVFAGSAAEFALNRAVDWLFFTGKLPGDPIGRLFSTAAYAQQIVFADASTATRTLDRIRAVHQAVERARGQRIPDWAHRGVLYMLIDYSERAHEMLARPLSADEQRELYDVFRRVGTGLGIPGLPRTYAGWRADRERHLRRDLLHGRGTEALYARYREHLGPWRYRLLLRVQAILAPGHVRGLLRLGRAEWLRPLFRLYPVLVRAGFRSIVQRLLMPPEHLPAIRGLDHPVADRPEPRSRPRGCPFHARSRRTA
ncbi:MAG TPA: oxygenase MpaB family protein [Longimicrobiaceae bacterium]|nr:oxygenase MpaB family protein [Longimicrobiaceae bacterium]